MTATAPRVQRQFALTEYGNGERFIAEHGDHVRWVGAWKCWLVWDGHRWKRDDTCDIERRAKQTVRGMWGDVARLESGDYRDALKKHAHKSEAMSQVRAMIDHAKSEAGIAVGYAAFDARPMCFNVMNGTLDLEEQRLREHTQEDLLTKLSPVVFDASAECPRWLAFLGRIFDHDADLIAYLQRAIGYSLTGDTREQVLHLLHGAGSNGKTTFLEVLSDLFGEYGTQADFATFLESKRNDGPRNDVARLAGARMVRSSELAEGKRFNESLIKTLTGTDTIAARFLYSEAFEFRPTFKLWLAGNHKPVIRGTDYAIWRRVRLIPFLVTISDEEKDDTLGATLKGELPGILNWALQGLADWFEQGLRPPSIVTLFTEQYRSESDVLGHFIEECCQENADARTGASDLYGAYKRWAESAGEWVEGQTAFGRKLQERGFTSMKIGGTKYRCGLSLLPSASTDAGGKPWFS